MDLIPDMTMKRAELSPDKPAFEMNGSGDVRTFGDVHDRSQRAAHLLQQRGLKSGDRVAILCLNRPDFFELLFACAKIGCIFVPLNWRQPVAELIPILEDCAPSLLFYDTAFAEVASALSKELSLTSLNLDEEGYEEELATMSPDAVPTEAWKSDQIWYLLYTSGTTGKPKAVIQTPRMAWANAVNIGQSMDIARDDVTVNYLPLFHTAGINLISLPVFLFGGTNIVMPKFEAGDLLALINEGRINSFLAVPAVYQALQLHPDFATTDFSGMKSWGAGGAPLPIPLLKAYAQRDAHICLGFGMTETGPTVFLMDKGAVLEKAGSCGKAQMLTEVRIAGAHDQALGDNEQGELQIRGPNITPGYYNNEQATKATFTKDGWLKTGDVAMRDEDGYYFIVDRIKDMFISGGENVYPAEVEKILNTHPAILEAIVVGVPDDKWGEVGEAKLIERPGMRVETSELGGWCRDKLAAYKIPKYFSVVKDFPRTAAGKVQKHVLKQQG
ncbi:MAG: long-chain fatty acid--CoA ligase [Cohaesibacter sp.]|jgi:fatty-acyl-CoA synthase|nr:long-chain fatty acid--CoA ligase [Cohaesibacter sp.]